MDIGAFGPAPRARRRALIALSVTEITSWGTLYYSLPVAASSTSTTTGWSRDFVMGCISGGLLLSAASR